MRVEVITATEEPVSVISMAAGTCYGKSDAPAKRVRTCYSSGHMSVFEHAGATFRVTGISRACSHQLVRHRLASFCQESQRYCKIDTDSDDWYVMPEWFHDTFSDDGIFWRQAFRETLANCAVDYEDAIDHGCRPEDARYLLPEACKTNITVTMNARELFHFLDLRQSRAAQWEIRELAYAMEAALSELDGWRELMALRGGDDVE